MTPDIPPTTATCEPPTETRPCTFNGMRVIVIVSGHPLDLNCLTEGGLVSFPYHSDDGFAGIGEAFRRARREVADLPKRLPSIASLRPDTPALPRMLRDKPSAGRLRKQMIARNHKQNPNHKKRRRR